MKKILLLIACVLFVKNSFAQQKELDSLVRELKKYPQSDTNHLKILLGIAHSYSSVDGNKGFAIALQAISLAKKLHYKKMEGTAYNYAAQNCQTLGNDSLAISYSLQSLKIKQELKDSIGSGISYHTMAISYFNRADYNTALNYEQQAVHLFTLKKDSARQAAALNSLGVDYQYLGNYPKALQYYQQAVYIWTQTGEKHNIADALQNIGLIYNDIKNHTKALEYYAKALIIHKTAGDFTGEADSYGNIANAYDDMNDTLNARINYVKGLKLSQQTNYEFGMASAMGNLAISYFHTNEFGKAIPYLQEALRKFTLMNDNTNSASMMDYLSAVYINAPDSVLKKFNISITNKLYAAEQLQLQSIRLATKSENIEELKNGYENLSEIYTAQKNYQEALSAYKQSTIYRDSLLNDDTRQQITRLEMQYQFSKTEDSIKAVNKNQQALASAQIQKQKVEKDATMAGAGFIILAGIGGFVFYKRNRDIKLQKNEAQLQQQITDTEMKALRAQMNPHFIFNSLNSIADYIDKNQTQIASDFTTKFAKLMRMVLENSEQKEIPLAEDLKALELYMQLESLRLKNKFSYEINIDDSIDKENTLVPPLILQPFVENSIWHGIAKKVGKGNLSITIRKEGDMLSCIVEDDGNGIINQSASNEKKSLGMRITKSRIDIINKLKNANASMYVYNKEHGVKAEVKLPMELSF